MEVTVNVKYTCITYIHLASVLRDEDQSLSRCAGQNGGCGGQGSAGPGTS